MANIYSSLGLSLAIYVRSSRSGSFPVYPQSIGGVTLREEGGMFGLEIVDHISVSYSSSGSIYARFVYSSH